jgi:hypothetical protein
MATAHSFAIFMLGANVGALIAFGVMLVASWFAERPKEGE